MLKPAKIIPEKFLDEYKSERTRLIRGRVLLLGILVIAIYTAVDFISYIAMSDFDRAEIPIWIFLVIGVAGILLLNARAKTFLQVKFNAYLLTAFLLLILTKVSIIYYSYIEMASTLYLFLLFLVSFTILWEPLEIIPISLMHIAAFSCLLVYFDKVVQARVNPNVGWYIDGIFLLLMGFVFCLVIRAKEATRDIENFLLLKDIEGKNTQMQKELELATKIHHTLIPKSISTDLVDIAVTYLPMQYIGGDYAKFHFPGKDKLFFMIGDITGHGVSAALLVNRLHVELEQLLKLETQPGALLNRLNDFILKEFRGMDMYLSAFCGLLDFKQSKLSYSNHGHPAQYIYRIKDSQITRLESQAALLGLPYRDKNIYQLEIDFGKGDKLLLFTDGVTETKNASGQEYGEEGLENFMRKNHKLLPDIFNKMLLDELNFFKSGEFKDDIFVLDISIK